MRSLLIGSANGVFALLWLAVLAVKVYALIDAVRRPESAWRVAVAQPKMLWVGILVLAILFAGIGILGIVALVATIYYVVDVRKRLIEVQDRGRGRW